MLGQRGDSGAGGPALLPPRTTCRWPWEGSAGSVSSAFSLAISVSLPGGNAFCQKNVPSSIFFPLALWKHCAFLLLAPQMVPALAARTEFPLSHPAAGQALLVRTGLH